MTLDTNNVNIAACAGGPGGGGTCVPALSPMLLILLSLALAMAAVFTLRR